MSMNDQQHKERSVESKETVEDRSQNVGAAAVRSTQRAGERIDEMDAVIDAVLEDNKKERAKIEKLIDDIGELFSQEDLESLAMTYVQKGGQ